MHYYYENLENLTFEQYLKRKFKPSTIKSYLFLLEPFHIKVRDPINAKLDDLYFFLEGIKKNPCTTLCAMKQYYNYLLDTEKIQRHPLKKLSLRRPKKPVQFQDLFDQKELEYLLNRPVRYSMLEYRNKAILSLLIYHGLTSENITRIRMDDIDLAEGEMYLLQGTRSVRRVIKLNDQQIDFIEKYLADERPQIARNQQRVLFLNKLGDPLTVDGLFRMVKPLNNYYPDRVLNPKTIRQSVTRNLTNEVRMPLVEVQKITGHKRISSILNYRSPDMKEMRAIILEFHPMDRFL
jgi:integrase/recombinase XerD